MASNHPSLTTIDELLGGLATGSIVPLSASCFQDLNRLMVQYNGDDWISAIPWHFSSVGLSPVWDPLAYILLRIDHAPISPNLAVQTEYLLDNREYLQASLEAATRVLDELCQQHTSLGDEIRMSVIPAGVAIIKSVFKAAAAGEEKMGRCTKTTLQVVATILGLLYRVNDATVDAVEIGPANAERLTEALDVLTEGVQSAIRDASKAGPAGNSEAVCGSAFPKTEVMATEGNGVAKSEVRLRLAKNYWPGRELIKMLRRGRKAPRAGLKSRKSKARKTSLMG